jgi:colanic acid/amylovoran biosynthesis glycosyltransferase
VVNADAVQPLSVVHAMDAWLPRTMAWMHTQVANLPGDVHSVVVCDDLVNLDSFPFPHLQLSVGPAWVALASRSYRLRQWRRQRTLMQTLRRRRARLLHSHFGPEGFRNLTAAAAGGVRHVVSFYGFDVGKVPATDPLWHGRYRAMFAAVDRVLCEGPHFASRIAALGCPAGKLTVHRLGVRLDEIPFRPRRWQPGTPLRVLIAASFTEKKGIPDAIAALDGIRRTTPVEVTIIGDARSGAEYQHEKQRILEAISAAGLPARLLGYQPHSVLHAEAASHHVFLSPSVTAADGDTEGGAPVTIIEMAASGMMVVSTTHCDIPGVITHGVTGLLAPERAPEVLTDHLRWLIAHPERWSAMAVAGRRHIEAEFDAIAQGRRLASLYRSVLDGPVWDARFSGPGDDPMSAAAAPRAGDRVARPSGDGALRRPPARAADRGRR